MLIQTALVADEFLPLASQPALQDHYRLIRVGCQKLMVPVTAGLAWRRTTMRRRLLGSLCEVPMVWSFVYLALGRILELIMLSCRSAMAKEIEILVLRRQHRGHNCIPMIVPYSRR